MIFRSFGTLVARFWPVLPVAWIGLLLTMKLVAPPLDSVTTDGEFAFLPPASESLQGERLLEASFSKNFWGSSVVIIARRDGSDQAQLTTADDVKPTQTSDREFVETILLPRLKELISAHGWDQPTPTNVPGEKPQPLVAKISTRKSDAEIGPLLDSQDGQATLVRISLTSEYMAKRNAPVINAIENLINPRTGELREAGLIPAGLDLYLSGPAVVGKDMRDAARDSAEATEVATILLVVTLLLLIYRAPLLAMIPLVTVFVGVECALAILTLLAEAGILTLFNSVEIYVTVVVYGAGIDYCMFLMARYKEELDAGATFDEAIAQSLDHVGAAIVSSAGTTIVGIGMMYFAEFGKFSQAGLAMSLSLAIVLTAAMTFTPSLLRLFGRWAFWPHTPREHVADSIGWNSPTRITAKLLEHERWRRMWDHLATSVARVPGRWWLATAGLMVPLAVVGTIFHDHLTYGLLEELPPKTLSVRGAEAVQDHFPAGEAAPVTVLIQSPQPFFGGSDGATALELRQASSVVGELTESLWKRRKELGIADIRSLVDPHGVLREAGKGIAERGVSTLAARAYYVSDKGQYAGHITRMDVVFEEDPFARHSIEQLNQLEEAIHNLLPAKLRTENFDEVSLIGPTASIRDLKRVTNRDQIRIDLMVLVGVFAVLILLLRQVMVAGYLIITVFFSYLVALGATVAFFWAINPGDFVGLDWKVPIFLFTILVAVGEDYNIYLVTRVDEEQRRRGGIDGVREGLARTGGIISSCGLIMAGTFSSLMFGSLAGMIQLGFALAFGVILDTFIVRPILVPAYLVMLNDGRFGRFSRFLGAYQPDQSPDDQSPVREGAERSPTVSTR